MDNPRSGAVIGETGAETIVDLAEASGGRVPSGDLLALLEAGPAALDAARAAADAGGGRPLDSVELLAPIRRPGKLLAVAGNFQAHIEEGGGQRVDKTKIVPKLFIKPSSAIIGPGEAVALPTVSNQLDWELELAIVIGTARSRHPARARPRPHRRLLGHQRHLGPLDAVGRRGSRTRAASTTSSTGSTASGATASRRGGRTSRRPIRSSPDPNELEMTLTVNDKTWQHGSTADMIFSPEEIISFASRWMTLEPGDVIAGGTLDGTGDAAGVYLKAGDVMDGTIGDLGTLVTPVVAAVERQGLTRGRARSVRRLRIGLHGRDLGAGHRPPRAGGDARRGQRRAPRRRRWPTMFGVEALDQDALLARPDIDAVVVATPVPTHRPHRRGGGPGRQARPRREADDQHPGRCRRDGRDGRRGGRPAGDRLAAPLPGRPDGGQGGHRRRPDREHPDDPGVRARTPAGTSRPTHWNSQRAQVSPYMDWGAHACDIIRWLTGAEATLAFAQFASYTDIPPTDQSSMATYTLDNGVLVQIWLTYELPPPTLGSAMQLLIAGSDGIIEADAYGTVRLATPAGGWETIFEQPPFDPLDAEDSVRLQAYANQLRDLMAAIAEGRDPFVSGRQGAQTTSWLEAAERSAETGQSVRLSLSDRAS